MLKRYFVLAAGIAVTLLVLLPTKSSAQSKGLSWSKKSGVYIAPSSKAIPSFPNSLNGFRYETGKDYWDNPVSVHGTIRLFEGQNWEGIENFPHTMNHCSDGIFMIRWRVANPDVRVTAVLGYDAATLSGAAKKGGYGFITGNNCEQPLFKFAGTGNGNQSNLVDVYYEIKFWQAAP
jgi:hypothetical protein